MKTHDRSALSEFRLNLPRSPQIPRDVVDLVRRICEAVWDQAQTYQWLDAREVHSAFEAAYPDTQVTVRQMDEFFLKLFEHTDRLVIDRFEMHSAAQDVTVGKDEFKMKRVYSFRSNLENLEALVRFMEQECGADAEETPTDAVE